MSSKKRVRIGGLDFGGGAPVRVESMLKSHLEDVSSCLRELDALKDAGCELVRVAFPSEGLGDDLTKVVAQSKIAVMADIHFNHKLALRAIDCGCGSVRINPGNMGSREGLMEVLSAARASGTIIRIGSNGGSLSAKQVAEQNGDRSLALVHAVEEQLLPLTDAGFEDIIISAKSSSVSETVRANLLLSQRYPFPLHVGITESGAGIDGAVKSATGLGLMLGQGVGDTMRVSLTGESVEEVRVAYGIQRALGIRRRGVDFVSCPGCGRRRIDVAQMAERVRGMLPEDLPDGISVAVMGCEVNGPKEAAAADFGVAGTAGGFVLFKKGVAVASGEIENLETAVKTHLQDLSR